ncbi:MAG: hypothetical protein IID34_11175 [Planctomycetes bacterium]|nr:hypothetical protein [Planctomycetota bacterium]MCH8965204.1 hypothetical protein [Planctomycetota bacterium]
MTNDEYHTRLQELLDKAAELPPEQQATLSPLIEETRIIHASILDSRRHIEDALATWRVELKYFLFSLEAAARERAENKD